MAVLVDSVVTVLRVLLGLRGRGPHSESRYCAVTVCSHCWVRVIPSIRRCPEPHGRSDAFRIGVSRYRICQVAKGSGTGQV
ncbi:MAG: hypothetical protein ABSB99_06255 [Acidimicrobiales bacterium]